MEIFDQSAVIPFREKSGKTEILLITTRKGNWTIPKGIIEENLSPQESALKESVEEAGVWGLVSQKKVGVYDYKKWGGICHVKVYTMKVTKVYSKWEEKKFRERLWVSAEKGVKMVSKKGLAKIIKRTFLNSKNEK